MKSILSHFIGLILITSAIIGFLICTVGIIAMWKLKTPVIQAAKANLEILTTTLASTNEGLTLAAQSLETASASIDALQTTVDTLAKSINDTTPLIDSLASLLSNELPDTIEATQTSLKSAQSSAKIMDNVLKVVTSIPFFPGEPYNPPVPLNVALGQVSDSLKPLPESFSEIKNSLEKTRGNLDVVKVDIGVTVENVLQIKQSLDASQMVISQYQTITNSLELRVTSAQQLIPKVINTSAWIATIVLVWLATTQIELFVQGQEMLWENKP
jgi:uncharacterized phage infection (PIP) family protein YhgE